MDDMLCDDQYVIYVADGDEVSYECHKILPYNDAIIL